MKVMNMLSELLGLIAKIPDTFWGVIVGGIISLMSVLLTNRANYQRLQAQLSHERELRKKERELSLKKDIYLAAAEAIVTGMTAIGYFPDMNKPTNKLTEAFAEKSPSIAKVHIIAEKETVRVVLNLMGELAKAYQQLSTKRNHLEGMKKNNDFSAKIIEYATECIAETARLNNLLILVFIAMRKELEVPIDECEFIQMFEQFSTKIQENWRMILESLN
jgi:hypothetical protein